MNRQLRSWRVCTISKTISSILWGGVLFRRKPADPQVGFYTRVRLD